MKLFCTLPLRFRTKESRVPDRLPPGNHQRRDPWHLCLWMRLRLTAWTVSFIPASSRQLTPKVCLWELPYIKGLDLRECIYIYIYKIYIYICKEDKGWVKWVSLVQVTG